MPRRTGERAKQEIKRAGEVRWQYLIRNGQFRAEVRELRKAFREDHEDAESKRQAIIQKWGLAKVPDDILQEPIIPDDIPRKLAYYEKFISCPPFGYPVEAITPLNSEAGSFLSLKVDLGEPVDLLLHFVAEALRVHRPVSQTRRRHDKADFQLKVFDLYEYERKNFEEIARSLEHRTRTIKGRRNTVRSAYVAAAQKIYGTSDRMPENTKTSHSCDSCSICCQAKTVKDFCRIGQAQLRPLASLKD